MGVRDPRRPRGPGRRRSIGRSGGSDHPQHHVRPGRGGRPPGLRVLAQRQPPCGRSRRASHRSRARATGWRSRGPGCRGQRPAVAHARRPDPARQRRLRRHVPPHLEGVGPTGHRVERGRSHRRRRARRRLAERHRHWSGSRRPPTRCSPASTSKRSPPWRTLTARWWWWTTPSPRRTCSSRCRWAPTSWCTRPPSTSAGTATWWAASWR